MKKIVVAVLALGALSTTAFASSRDVSGPFGSADVPSVEMALSSANPQIAMNGDVHQPLTRYERDSKVPGSSAS